MNPCFGCKAILIPATSGKGEFIWRHYNKNGISWRFKIRAATVKAHVDRWGASWVGSIWVWLYGTTLNIFSPPCLFFKVCLLVLRVQIPKSKSLSGQAHVFPQRPTYGMGVFGPCVISDQTNCYLRTEESQGLGETIDKAVAVTMGNWVVRSHDKQKLLFFHCL